jgi:ADP-heptose:LPS heptosyltransferase
LVSALGCEVTTRDYFGLLKPSYEQAERANALLAAHGIDHDDPIAALAPGTSSRRDVKAWTEDGFASVGQHLTDRGLKVVLLGTEPCEPIAGRCADIIDLGGRTNLADVLGIVARCRMLVGVDSGVLHLCAAAGTKVVGLYGPSNSRITGPRGEGHVVVTAGADCSPCLRTECKFNRICMTDLAPQAVIAAVDSVLVT